MRAPALVLLGLIVAAHPAFAAPAVAPQRDWRQLTTPNFRVIGNAGERDLRRTGLRLEQFREALGVLFPKAILASTVPTTVVVFRGQKQFEPFQPLYNGKPNTDIGGYFVGGEDANYVAMRAATEESLGVVYHEYVHLVVNNASTNLPVWFNEGLAEYYATFEVAAGGTEAFIGRVQVHHVRRLREQWLPLAALVVVGRDSPHYNEAEKASVFYAESWALVHYLLNGQERRYAKHVAAFVAALSNGDGLETSCTRALGTTPAALERELRQYVQQERFLGQLARFTERLAAGEQAAVTPLRDAAAYAALGDLLFRMRRPEEARAYLDEALALDPALPEAHAAMGRLLVASGRRDEARPHFKLAAASPDAPWTSHYAYAALLADGWGGDADRETTAAMEGALRKTLELRPSFPEAYIRLAWLKSQTETGLPEAVQLARKGLELAPGQERGWLLLAQIYLLIGDVGQARPITARLAHSSDVRIATDAATLLTTIETELRRQAASPVRQREDQADPSVQRLGATRPGPVFREPRTGEERLSGTLASIECSDSGLTFVVRHEEHETRLNAASWNGVDFISYRADLQGQIPCGRQSDPVVIVTFEPASPGRLPRVVAVEFVPEGYEPK